MDSGGYLVRAITIIIFILVFVAIINFFLPFIKKAQLNELGREYVNLMEVENGLTASDETDILAKLTNKGFENIAVTLSLKGTVAFKEPLVLNIVAEYPIKIFGVFTSSDLVVPMVYEQSINSKRIEE